MQSLCKVSFILDKLIIQTRGLTSSVSDEEHAHSVHKDLPKELVEFVEAIPDPHRTKGGHIVYVLKDILLLELMARMNQCVTRKDIIEFGKSHLPKLQRMGMLMDGVPSEPTLYRILQKVDSQIFKSLLHDFVATHMLVINGDGIECVAVDRSMITRELNRNKDMRNGKYNPELAQRKRDARMCGRNHFRKMDDSMKELVDKHLEMVFSPEQISGRMKKEGVAIVSHETIHKYVYDDKHFDEITEEQVAKIQTILNNRPRKRLGYKTPFEAFLEMYHDFGNNVAFLS